VIVLESCRVTINLSVSGSSFGWLDHGASCRVRIQLPKAPTAWNTNRFYSNQPCCCLCCGRRSTYELHSDATLSTGHSTRCFGEPIGETTSASLESLSGHCDCTRFSTWPLEKRHPVPRIHRVDMAVGRERIRRLHAQDLHHPVHWLTAPVPRGEVPRQWRTRS
jgi:hypothetical protein